MTITPDPIENASSEPKRAGGRSAKLGVAAGVLAGGAIGLVATMPSLTSAAAEEPSGDAVVALQESPDETTTADQPDERPEPGERLRETLQPLVEDGTIDDGQADAVTDHLVENRPERAGRGHRHAHHGGEVAELLGIEREALRAELEAGNSIADVAEANGVDVQTVIDSLIADAEERAAAAIERGADEERVAERLERVTERIEEGVYRTREG